MRSLRPEHGEWQQLRLLEEALNNGKQLQLDQPTLALIRTTGAQVAFADDEIERQLSASPEALVRKIRERIRDGSRRLSRAIVEAEKLVARGEREAASELLRDLSNTEVVPFYRELAQNEVLALKKQE